MVKYLNYAVKLVPIRYKTRSTQITCIANYGFKVKLLFWNLFVKSSNFLLIEQPTDCVVVSEIYQLTWLPPLGPNGKCNWDQLRVEIESGVSACSAQVLMKPKNTRQPNGTKHWPLCSSVWPTLTDARYTIFGILAILNALPGWSRNRKLRAEKRMNKVEVMNAKREPRIACKARTAKKKKHKI